MKIIWKQLERHFDLLIMAIVSLFVAGMAWANLNDRLTVQESHLMAIDVKQSKQDDAMNAIQQTSARTEQKVDDIAVSISDLKTWLRHESH